MADEQILFFDIPSKPPLAAWSLNPWKSRLVLHYKNLNYTTEWLEYPEIAPRLKDHIEAWPENSGLPPGTTHTIPALKLPSGEWLMDSKKIAHRLEELYPSPPLHLDSPVIPKLEAALKIIMKHLSNYFMPLLPSRILNEVSHAHWYKSREPVAGMPLDQLFETKGKTAWHDLEKEGTLREVTDWLKENEEGPFFLGKEASYADFVWIGFLIFMKCLGEEDAYQQVLKRSGDAGVHERLMEAAKQWTERNDR
ncbi:hypothetical protein QBC38DRAFT_486493 [Podospora fimiseda]|uniref:GST N-terminal domain-containing protein n=1 Tax=Podospora fimiseda TaxID=252190 RepID=A0AAN7BIF7_9PEZI|nr:hypothetical protein QBC38DRAFT_486493 [Podospora fimiseda]